MAGSLYCRLIWPVNGESGLARLERALFIGWAIALVVFLILALDSLVTAHGKDLSVYIYVAQGIPSGDIPYVDRWENKGPLTYLLTLLGTTLGGTIGIWLLGAAFLLCSTWFAYKITREAFGATAALLAISLFLFSFRKVADGGGLTEHYALLFQCLAVFLFLRLSRGRAQNQTLICTAIGALGAAAFLLRPNLVGVWIAIGLYWVLQLWFHRRQDTLRWIVWSVVGGLTVIAVMALVFAILGALGAMWDAMIVYNFKYSDAMLINRLGVLRDLRSTLLLVSLPLMAGWCIGLYYQFSGRAKDTSFEHILPLGLILLPLETLLLTTSGYQFNHYYVALLPAAALTLAFLAKFILVRSNTAPLVLATVLLIPVVYYNLPDYRTPYRTLTRIVDKYAHPGEISADRYSNVSERVRRLTGPDDAILVWGNQPQIYLQAKRDAPTRFFTQFPLINRGYADQSVRDEFTSGFINDRPIVIVDTGDGRLPPLNRADRLDWVPVGRRHLDPDLYRRFFEFIDAEYAAIEEVDGFVIYRLMDRT